MPWDGGRVVSGTPKIVVLGAGSTGLGTALGLVLHGWRHPVTVVERQAGPGGLAGSFHWNGHTIDHGPHRLSPNLEAVRVLASELLGPDLRLERNLQGIQIDGKCYQFPPRVLDWVSPRSAWLMGSLVSSFLAARLAWVTRRFNPDTFESTLVKKFGRKFYESIAAPMAEKVWIDPARIDPSFAEQRFSPVTPREIVKRAIFPSQELNPAGFLYPRLGFQQLWDRMAESFADAGGDLLYGSEASRIEVEGRRIVRIHLSTPGGPRLLEADDLHVVSTVPLPCFVGQLSGFDAEGILARLGRVRFRSMLLGMFEFDQPRTLPCRHLFFPQRDFPFNRLYEPNQYSRDCVLPGKSVVVGDITVERGDPAFQRPDGEVLAGFREGLGRLPFIPMDRMTASGVRRVEFAYPVPDLESRLELHHVLHSLGRLSNLTLLGRFSVGEYDNSDYALDNGMTLAAMLSGRISRMEFLCRIHAKRGRAIVG